MLNQRNLLGVAFALAVVIGLLPGFSSGPFAGLSGAPGDDTCTLCHGSFPLNSGTAIADFDISGPVSTVGGPLTINVGFPTTTVGRHGFEITARDSTGTTGTAGFPGAFTITDPANTQYAFFGSDVTYVSHTSAGSFASSWSLDWAPDASTPAGPITFYAAGNAANGDGTASGDYIFTESFEVFQAEVSSSSATWSAGANTLNLSAPSRAFDGYAMVISEDPTNTPVSPALNMQVNPFSFLAQFTLTNPALFQNFIGVLDATGSATATALIPPIPPSAVGATVYAAFITFDPTQLPNLVATEVSNEFAITLQ